MGGLVRGKMGKEAYPSWDSLVWRKKTEMRTEEEMKMNAIRFGGLVLQSYNFATADTNKCICAFASPAWPCLTRQILFRSCLLASLAFFWPFAILEAVCLVNMLEDGGLEKSCDSNVLKQAFGKRCHTNAQTLLCHAVTCCIFFWGEISWDRHLGLSLDAKMALSCLRHLALDRKKQAEEQKNWCIRLRSAPLYRKFSPSGRSVNPYSWCSAANLELSPNDVKQ